MAITHKAARARKAEADKLQYAIRVLDAVGDLMEFANALKVPAWDAQRCAYTPAIEERIARLMAEYDVKREDIVYKWSTL